MSRLGIGVEWSEEAVRQLTDAAAALEAYLESNPDQAQAVIDSPESVLQSLIDQGLVATPVDELRAAMAATRERGAAARDG